MEVGWLVYCTKCCETPRTNALVMWSQYDIACGLHPVWENLLEEYKQTHQRHLILCLMNFAFHRSNRISIRNDENVVEIIRWIILYLPMKPIAIKLKINILFVNFYYFYLILSSTYVLLFTSNIFATYLPDFFWAAEFESGIKIFNFRKFKMNEFSILFRPFLIGCLEWNEFEIYYLRFELKTNFQRNIIGSLGLV